MAGEATRDSLPRALGRFEIVGVLARRSSSTASTILVARAGRASRTNTNRSADDEMSISISPLRPEERTAQLERPVTIKLLASTIAASPRLASPFLEAARQVTELRHPNLPVVHEVAHGGDHLYLVMEYLKGETVAAVLRALQQRGETLDFTLAAHIIAEAAAGLHAAHERGVLHEQLTPHDLFIGYDGSVRVLDVGVAAARSRALGELGMRARFVLQYSSPERCRRETLDAQADVFSLGALLWELETGISPFERARDEDTIKAICDEPVVPPSVAFRGLPEHVSRITMQALERLPVKRYPSALALHDALRGSVKLLGMGSSPQRDLAAVMRGLFEKRIRDKDEMVVRILAGKGIDGLDVGEPEEDRVVARVTGRPPQHPLDAEVETPSVIIARQSAPAIGEKEPATEIPVSSDGTSSQEDVPPLPVRSRSRTVAGVVAALVAAALLVVLVVASGQQSAKSDPKSIASIVPPSASVAALVSVPSPPPAPTAPTPSTSADDVDEPVVTAPPIVGEETTVHIETIPSRAAIYVGGAKRGVSPLDLKFQKGSSPIVIELRHAGFSTWREKVVPDQNQKLRLTLVAAKGSPQGPNAGASTATTANPYHKFQ